MSTNQLRQSASVWGSQLAAAGINVDLAPVLGTVVVNRAANAPIGALYRDFGLDTAGNAAHGTAFVRRAWPMPEYSPPSNIIRDWAQ